MNAENTKNAQLMWFRNDLRLDDNSALASACQSGPVIAVFLVCPDQWRLHEMAPIRVDLIRRRLEALGGELTRLNIPLLIRQTATFDEAPKTLIKLMQELGAQRLHFNREYLVNEKARDQAVCRALDSAGLQFKSYQDALVVPPGELKTGSGGFYKVYSPFRRAWQHLVDEQRPDLLPLPQQQPRSAIESDPVPDQIDGYEAVSSEDWPVEESAILDHLKDFCESRLTHYAQDRDMPATDGTSRISAYLNIGALSPRRALQAGLDANGGELASGDKGAVTWISELIWREFYYHLIDACPDLVKGKAFQTHTEAVRWRDSDTDFEAWAEGKTGQPLVDAGMRQLAATGWMHNRVRMVTAMFLSKNLLIDWRRGESHFMKQLIDGDFALNNGGWQWSASTGTDAAPYFRVFNPFSQSERFDPEGVYIKRWVPELSQVPAAALHDPAKLDKHRPADYPALIVDIKASRKQAIQVFANLDKS